MFPSGPLDADEKDNTPPIPPVQLSGERGKVFSIYRGYSPVLGGAISLSSVLEPVADLRGGETGALRQFSLLPRRRVRVGGVPIPQDAPGLLLEAVRRLLAVPDRAR